MGRIKPHVRGTELLGAGGSGFILMICNSRQDSGQIRAMMEVEPPNSRARFLDYQINYEGLLVTAAKGLRVTCRLDRRLYPVGHKVSDEEYASVNLQPHSFHGEWNYLIQPGPKRL